MSQSEIHQIRHNQALSSYAEKQKKIKIYKKEIWRIQIGKNYFAAFIFMQEDPKQHSVFENSILDNSLDQKLHC